MKTQTMINKAGQALFEYERGTGIPAGSRWSKADYMTTERYKNRAKIVLDSVIPD